MDDIEGTLAAMERSARSVRRVSGAIKAICVVMLAIAACMMLYAVSRLGRHVDDFVGFGTIAVGIAALALVFWSIATFHAAFGQSMRLAAQLHRNVERLMRMQEQAHEAATLAAEGRASAGAGAARSEAHGAASAGGASGPSGASGAKEAPVAAFAGERGEPSSADARALGGAIGAEEAATERSAANGEAAAPQARAAPSATAPAPGTGASSIAGPAPAQAEPAMKQCPHCRGSIRADVLRCRHCMERV